MTNGFYGAANATKMKNVTIVLIHVFRLSNGRKVCKNGHAQEIKSQARMVR
jgi:hypothetical protein